MIDPRNVCLGRNKHDPARVANAQKHVMGAAAPIPNVLDRSGIPFIPGDYGNSTDPICTAVAKFNAARAFSWVNAKTDIVVNPAKPKAFFAETLGIPDTEAAIVASDGAVMLNVAEYASTHGIDVGQQVRLVPTFAVIEPGDRMAIADAALRFGAADLGLALSISDQKMGVWDTLAPASAGDPTPGSWGGHDSFIFDWDGLDDTSLVRFGTWGYWQLATWRWVHQRAEEAYSLFWQQLLPAVVA